MSTQLKEELVSLIHHIELNKVGWWDKTIQRIILGIIWSSGNRLSAKAVYNTSKNKYHINITQDIVDRMVQTSIDSDILALLPSEELKILEEPLKSFETELEQTKDVAEEAKKSFTKIVYVHCPSVTIDETWHLFNNILLMPLIKELGAKTYRFIAGRDIELKTSSFKGFLRHFPEECHELSTPAIKCRKMAI
jgi:hypothetical protein